MDKTSSMFCQPCGSFVSNPQCSAMQVELTPATVQTLSVAVAQAAAQVPAEQTWTPPLGRVTAHLLPQALQLSGSVWRLTQAVGLLAGDGWVAGPALAAQVPV